MFKIRKSTVDRLKDGGYILYNNSKIAIVRKYGNRYKSNFKDILTTFEFLISGIAMILMSPFMLIYGLVGFIPIIQFIDYKKDEAKKKASEQASKELEELLKERIGLWKEK